MASQTLGDNAAEGVILGQAGGKVGFYGTAPIVQASFTAITDGSTGTAAPTNGIQPLTATYNSTLLINSIATLADGINRLRTGLRAYGIFA